MTSEFLLRFLLYELDPTRIEFIMSGSTSKHLNVKDLRSMEVAVPPLSLQEQFTTFFNRLKKEDQVIMEHSQYLDNLFQSLQQRAFRGELTPPISMMRTGS
jgi:type I restriction enzyme S subunit